jgi:two-component system response regulator MtrA
MARILIVDDDPDMRALMRLTLAKLGHQPSLAATGMDGLKLAENEPFDLMVLDLMMPDIDGYEVMRRLRANPNLKDLPIIVLTARAQAADYDSVIESGADAFLPKPYDPDALHRRIGELLKRSKTNKGAGAQASPEVLNGHVTVVLGLRGGIGATTCAVTIAGTLLRQGSRVCLVDLSPSGGHVALQLRLGTGVTWRNLPPAPDTTAVAQTLVRHDSGLVVLAAPSQPVRQGPSAESFRATLEALQIFFTEIVIDAAPVLDAATEVALAAADQIVVVCTPEVGAVHSTIGTLQALGGLRQPEARVVVLLNQVSAEASLPTSAIEKALGGPPDLVVPYDRQQALALAHGKPLVFSQPGALLPAAVGGFLAQIRQKA